VVAGKWEVDILEVVRVLLRVESSGWKEWLSFLMVENEFGPAARPGL